MQRSELTELHYITAIANIPSMLQRGLLSHRRADQVPHQSVAMVKIQGLLRRRRFPVGARSTST